MPTTTDTLAAEEALKQILSRSRQSRRDAAFYLRLLAQAVLTHGEAGFLNINYGHAPEAFRIAESGAVEFGNGGIRILHTPTKEV